MRNLVLALTCSGSILFAAVAWGQDAPGPRALPDVAGQLSDIKFSIQNGRILVATDQEMLERGSSSSDSSGVIESMSVSSNGNHRVTLKYERNKAGEKFRMDVGGGEQITFSLQPAKAAHVATVDFHQPEEGPLKLTIVQDGVTTEVKGDSLWHLLLAEPDLCRRHLLPILESFHPNWRLADVATQIEKQTLRTADAYRPENIDRWAAWVADLASDRFVVREHADRQLRGAGMAVIPYLESLDRKKLDFEQWSRIREIVGSQSDEEEDDTPATAARRLIGDRSIWLAFLGRPDEKVRRTAARQLGFLMGGPIEFDPAGPEAMRRDQIDALRRRIETEAANAARSE